MQIKKKAFTLTELLVVVMVIGILSAIVLPKFGKVLETRKTTEAESIMSAIRTEQEKRCALERPYAGQWAQLTDIVPSSESKHFQYALTSTGVTAGSKSSAYTLEMPSYADGRICCSGSKCAELNKDYPGCSDSTFVASLTASPSDCGATDTDEPTPCSNLPSELTQTEQCGCNNGGTKTNTFNTTTCQWEYGTCSIADACECTGPVPTGSQTCEPSAFPGQNCGAKAAVYQCNTATGEYDLVGYSETCTPTDSCACDENTKPTDSQPCTPEGYDTECGRKEALYTCNYSTGGWDLQGYSDTCETTEECADPCACSFEAGEEVLGTYDGRLTQEYVEQEVGSTDTCDGDRYSKFTCESREEPSGEFECIDILYDDGFTGSSGSSGSNDPCKNNPNKKTTCGKNYGSSTVVTCPCGYHCVNNGTGGTPIWGCEKGSTPMGGDDPLPLTSGTWTVTRIRCCPMGYWEEDDFGFPAWFDCE